MFWKKQKIVPEPTQPNIVVAKKQGVESTPWKSIYTVSIFTFCTNAQFTLYFSSMWPFLQVVDKSTTEAFYGLIIAAYSMGQILSGPVIGWWSTRIKSIIAPSQFCLFISLIGNMIYVTSSLAPSHQKWIVLAARFLVGIGESRTSLFQTFTATASTQKDRTKALSITTGGSALGFSVGPAIQLIFTPFGYPGYHIAGKLWINMYTAPAIICVLINLLCMIVLQFIFQEKYAGLANPDAKKAIHKKIYVPKYDKLAVATCHFSRFVQIFVFVNLETIGTPFAMAMFALTSSKTVQTLSIAHSVSGLIAFCCYIVHALSRKEIIDYRKLLIMAYTGFLLFHIVTIPLPFFGHIKTYSKEEYDIYKASNFTKHEPVGCAKDTFAWCKSTGVTNFWIFIIGIVFFLGFCWPNVNVSLTTLLSKILGPRRQANQQSIYQISASCARLVGPIVISNVYTIAGPMYTWITEMCILVLILIVCFVTYGRMVPLKMPDPDEPIDECCHDDSDITDEIMDEDEIKVNMAKRFSCT